MGSEKVIVLIDELSIRDPVFLLKGLTYKLDGHSVSIGYTEAGSAILVNQAAEAVWNDASQPRKVNARLSVKLLVCCR
jgi:hypothetical protein